MKYCPNCPPDKTYDDHLTRCPNHHIRLSIRDPYRLVGSVINGKYKLEALLGLGGMGAVYLATHLGINRQMAFKILKPDLAASDPSVLESFRREATISGGLSHPHIVSVTDADVTSEGVAFMVMELLECPTLEDELNRVKVFPIHRTHVVLEQICSALQTAHSHHIVHRDLKPANIALLQAADQSEVIKVLDFGIAKTLDEGAGKVSQAMGTPIYASPEQFSPGVLIDGRSDLYSLGVMTFQMLTGTVPFRGKSVGEIIRQHLSAPPPPLRNFNPQIPAEIEQVVLMSLAKDPNQRPATAEEFFTLFHNAVIQNAALFPSESYTNRPTLSVSQGLKATIAGSTATLSLSGIPPKSEILLNGMPKLTTDISGGTVEIADLPSGHHNLVVRKPGYESWSTSVMCQPGERKELKITLKPQRSSSTHQGLSQTTNQADAIEFAVTARVNQPSTTGSGARGGQTLYAPPPATRLPYPQTPALNDSKSNKLTLGIVIASIVVLGIGGVALMVKKNTKTDATEVVKTPAEANSGLTGNISAYRESFDRLSNNIHQAADSVPVSGPSSAEELKLAREEVDHAQAVVGTSASDLGLTEPPTPEIRIPHENLKDRYQALKTSLDNYSVALRNYEFALTSTGEYNANDRNNPPGTAERAEIYRCQSAFRDAWREAQTYEQRLRTQLK